MQLPLSDQLNIPSLSRLFANTSECYKFFWFQAILTKVKDGRSTFTFDELVDEMIADAWYMVSEYHLNLGPNDNLESLVRYIHETTGMKSTEEKKVILNYLSKCEDSQVYRIKKILIANVPYRLQAPFMPDFKGRDFDLRLEERLERINRQEHLLYYFVRAAGHLYNGLDTIISVEPEWMDYFTKNIAIVEGWLSYQMIIYLQKRNPSVPGIADKLYPPQERRLAKVQKYWKLIMDIVPVREIYGEHILTIDDISIDHFVPWSYVAHDELWNLHPTTKRINSSKSNHLPDWESYFLPLARLEYQSYRMLWIYDVVHREFDICAREHINNPEVLIGLYRQGLSEPEFCAQLEKIMLPVYQSAKNCGFSEWIYPKERQEEQ